jgi:hypothetical protein
MSRFGDKLKWFQWNPGLDNGHRTLGEVLESLPAAAPSDIPLIIRLFENPSSKIAFPGAITLARHDAIHVLLGRGLSNQDEAFVIGFTMGAASDIKDWQMRLFRFIATRLYPAPYRWNDREIMAYDLAFAKARGSAARDLEHFPFERFLDMPVDELRRRLGIDAQKLYATYRFEKILLPDTPASRRLDADWQGVDPSDTVPPEGVESGWVREKPVKRDAEPPAT